MRQSVGYRSYFKPSTVSRLILCECWCQATNCQQAWSSKNCSINSRETLCCNQGAGAFPLYLNNESGHWNDDTWYLIVKHWIGFENGDDYENDTVSIQAIVMRIITILITISLLILLSLPTFCRFGWKWWSAFVFILSNVREVINRYDILFTLTVTIGYIREYIYV